MVGSTNEVVVVGGTVVVDVGADVGGTDAVEFVAVAL